MPDLFQLAKTCSSLILSLAAAARGLSLCRATMAATPVTLLDCEGSLAPAALTGARCATLCAEVAHCGAPFETALPERQATENVLERLSVCIADYLVYVVDDFTSVDQRAVHRLTQMMRTKVPNLCVLRPAGNIHVLTVFEAGPRLRRVGGGAQHANSR
eukprot:3651975-Prymnesium_polylepis.1